ncbi:LysR family transcriptional regulator [Tropicimonas sediminicola]|uniref:DNA-binding transcriptional regulator, LysR family n=1 Tax=Tropicimonas sediminicola TaxID=1031541 RepID=A0A239KP87_9RHOB|nr:LysR family transcriptional regulator [Tropicimonas sediminicola]SNT19885.1 DNA-binding transcriptional regulator, LysR family [Tropicimonas sediminicola]
MDIESLRLFVLAAEKLNIGAAGRDLGLAPAVASARLARLEKSVGADLLHRSTRRVSLSQDGAEFLPFAREILAQEAAARAALGQRGVAATGTLRFAAPSSFAQLYIMPLVTEFLEAQPGITLDMRLSDTQFNLIEGSFDLALRSAPLAETALKGRKLADETRILCASPGYLAEYGTPETVEDLETHRLVAFRDRVPRPLMRNGQPAGAFDPRPERCRLVMDDGASQRGATLAGAGISVNSLWSVYRELVEGQLVRVLPEIEVADGSVLWLVYPKANVLSPKVRVFMDFLIDRIGRTPPWRAG